MDGPSATATSDLVIERLLPVPVDRVWAAWTEPELIVNRSPPSSSWNPKVTALATPPRPCTQKEHQSAAADSA
jgi:hypothetical protein